MPPYIAPPQTSSRPTISPATVTRKPTSNPHPSSTASTASTASTTQDPPSPSLITMDLRWVPYAEQHPPAHAVNAATAATQVPTPTAPMRPPESTYTLTPPPHLPPSRRRSRRLPQHPRSPSPNSSTLQLVTPPSQQQPQPSHDQPLDPQLTPNPSSPPRIYIIFIYNRLHNPTTAYKRLACGSHASAQHLCRQNFDSEVRAYLEARRNQGEWKAGKVYELDDGMGFRFEYEEEGKRDDAFVEMEMEKRSALVVRTADDSLDPALEDEDEEAENVDPGVEKGKEGKEGLRRNVPVAVWIANIDWAGETGKGKEGVLLTAGELEADLTEWRRRKLF